MLFANGLWACSCATLPQPSEAFEQSSAVFVGEVVDIDDRLTFLRKTVAAIRQLFGKDPVSDGTYCTSAGFEVRLQVKQVWKGNLRENATVFTGRGGGDCGFPFEVGKEYLIYVPIESWENCDVDICSRSAEVAYAEEDLQYLDAR